MGLREQAEYNAKVYPTTVKYQAKTANTLHQFIKDYDVTPENYNK